MSDGIRMGRMIYRLLGMVFALFLLHYKSLQPTAVVHIMTTSDLDVFDLLGSTLLLDSVFVWVWGFTHAASRLHTARQFIFCCHFTDLIPIIECDPRNFRRIVLCKCFSWLILKVAWSVTYVAML